MLHAILFNKAGKSLTSNESHWRQLFTASEDSLTSTIFGYLLHLPVELFWTIMNNACYIEDITTHYPKIQSVEFWPHWSPAESGNTNYVEPDVFIRTKDLDLIIEAKRFDDNQQSPAQWRKEIQGYINEYGNEGKEVIFLALGGLNNEKSESIELTNKSINVLKCRWNRILNEVKVIHSKLEKNRLYLNNIESISIVLNDIILGFGIHGYSTGIWPEDENFNGLTGINYREPFQELELKLGR